MGHSCSSVTLLNLIRLGNKKVLDQYNFTGLREAAQQVTRITTGPEEYMSAVGLAILFDRSGGKLTDKMSTVIAREEPSKVHAQELIAEIRAMWDEWDLKDGERGDQLAFDAFYNWFLAPYFGCYRCDETKCALKAIEMDQAGTADWKEFALYPKWAIREYPETKTAEELLSIAFRKGLIPAMQDELLKQDEGQREVKRKLEEDSD